MNHNLYESLKRHGHKGGLPHFALPVMLHASHNPYIEYPAKGLLVIIEQGVDMSVIKAGFRKLEKDGSVGVLVEVKKPQFSYEAF